MMMTFLHPFGSFHISQLGAELKEIAGNLPPKNEQVRSDCTEVHVDRHEIFNNILNYN